MPCVLKGRLLPALCLQAVVALGGCSGTSDDDGPADPGPSSLEVVFTPSGGTFLSSQSVELGVARRGARIHYTLDGTMPTASSPVYGAPLQLAASTRVRALALVPEESGSDAVPMGGRMGSGGSAGGSGIAFERGPIASETYLRVASDAATFTSHLPILIVHTFESGRLDPQSDEFVPATLTLMEPTGGVSNLVGRASLDTRIGIHVRGATSRDFPKKQYAVEFRADGADEDFDRAMLEMPAESDWVLSDPVPMDRALVRNALAYALSNRIGRYAPRTRFVEAFLADSGGDVRNANFLGFYTVIEKIKRGPERVDIVSLTGKDLSGPSVTGGFILRIDKGANHLRAGGRDLQFVYPEPEEMALPVRQPQVGFIRDYLDEFAGALSAPDFRNRTTGRHYSELIDVDAWIDHNILNALTKNVDALRISAYFHKDREGLLCAGPIWDFDRSLGTPYDERAREPEEWKLADSDGTDYFADGWWANLFRDPSFKTRYKARFSSLLERELSPAQLDQVVDSLAGQVGAAAQRNFARWPDSPPRNGSHQAEVTLLKDFLRRRVTWVRAELAKW
ncbi:MAG TPA: CotH kinase family protein [Polyangiaceae bacterium]